MRSSAEPATAVDVARRIADALEQNDLPYAIGGALALAYYAPPRATVDVDVNVFVNPDHGLSPVLHALAQAGFTADVTAVEIERQARREAQFRGRASGLRVDVFVPAVAYYATLESRRRRVDLLGKPLWVLGPEDLVILKLLFFRRKDLADVEAIARDQGAALDLELVRRILGDLVGMGDERLSTLEEIVKETRGS